MSSLTRNESKKMHAANVYVEPARPGDVDQIWAIYRDTRLASQPNAELGISRGDVWHHFFDGPGAFVEDEKRTWGVKVINPNDQQQVLVAVQPLTNQVEGFVWPNISDDERRLNKLYVAKAVQGMGIGSKLIEATKAWHHFEPIWLKVASYNPAIQLYERHGFVVARQIEQGYTIGSKWVPQTEMVYPGYKSIAIANGSEYR